MSVSCSQSANFWTTDEDRSCCVGLQYRDRADVIRADEEGHRVRAAKIRMREMFEDGQLSEKEYTAFLRNPHNSAALTI